MAVLSCARALRVPPRHGPGTPAHANRVRRSAMRGEGRLIRSDANCVPAQGAHRGKSILVGAVVTNEERQASGERGDAHQMLDGRPLAHIARLDLEHAMTVDCFQLVAMLGGKSGQEGAELVLKTQAPGGIMTGKRSCPCPRPICPGGRRRRPRSGHQRPVARRYPADPAVPGRAVGRCGFRRHVARRR